MNQAPQASSEQKMERGRIMKYRLGCAIAGKGDGPAQFRQTLYGIAVGPEDRLHAAGDSEVKVFDAGGALLARWPTAAPAYCVTVATNGDVYVGEPGQVQRFDARGQPLSALRDEKRLRLPTSLAVHGDFILAGDLYTRAIHRFDRSGRHLNTIGSNNKTGGFMIPNSQIDFAVDAEGIIHAVNPGKHRVERYALDGALAGRFGRFTGTDPEGFSGCCNPTNIAVLGDGNVVVAVKAAPALKIYDGEGKLRAVFGTEHLDPQCRHFDLAVDRRLRIYAADSARLRVCVFVPEEAAAGEAEVPGKEGDRGR